MFSCVMSYVPRIGLHGDRGMVVFFVELLVAVSNVNQCKQS